MLVEFSIILPPVYPSVSRFYMAPSTLLQWIMTLARSRRLGNKGEGKAERGEGAGRGKGRGRGECHGELSVA